MIFSSVEEHSYYDDELKEEFGGKAANLIRMSLMGLNVPKAYMLGTGRSLMWEDNPQYVMNIVKKSIPTLISHFEHDTNRVFGPLSKNLIPLLFSVRSGAPVSMPGMMDTVLNVGLNDKSVRALASNTNLEFAWDSYRRFIQNYATTVLGQDKNPYQELVSLAEKFCPTGMMTVRMSQHLVSKFKELCPDFPQDVTTQLVESIEAVFKSWMSERAIAYRKAENISDSLGTGVIVQQMVFGNMNTKSGTGVLFTRNPVTGHSDMYGDFLVNAQGEDVVDGSHQTMPIASMESLFPDAYDSLRNISRKLELELKDMCDIEFTIEDGTLWILQVRSGKRSSTASLRIPLELLNDGIVTIDEALTMISSVKPTTESSKPTDTNEYMLAGKGMVASEGDVEGVMAFSSLAAETLSEHGNVILVSQKTDPADMPGIIASVGILTLTGGLVSHAAVVARSWDKTCIVGAAKHSDIRFTSDDEGCTMLVANGQKFLEGDQIILRNNGEFYLKHAS